MKTHVPVHQTQKNRRPGAKMLRQFCVALAIFGLGRVPAPATGIYTIFMDSGTGGFYMPGQSYNETRAVDVTVLSSVNLNVSSMTLSGINGSALAKAVIYDSNTQLLIASAQGTLTGGTITLPISATLVSGHEYRIGFFGLLGSGTGFLPNSFPYIESSGSLRINGAWDTATDSFPNFTNLEVPLVSMQVSPVPEPGTLALIGLGLFLPVLLHKQRALNGDNERAAGR